MAETVSLRVTLRYRDVEEFSQRFAENISSAGLFLRTRTPKVAGTRIRFELSLADGRRVLKGEGVVVQVRHDDKPGMALRFSEIDDDSLGLVQRVVERYGQGTLAPTPLPASVSGATPTPGQPRPNRPMSSWSRPGSGRLTARFADVKPPAAEGTEQPKSSPRLSATRRPWAQDDVTERVRVSATPPRVPTPRAVEPQADAAAPLAFDDTVEVPPEALMQAATERPGPVDFGLTETEDVSRLATEAADSSPPADESAPTTRPESADVDLSAAADAGLHTDESESAEPSPGERETPEASPKATELEAVHEDPERDIESRAADGEAIEPPNQEPPNQEPPNQEPPNQESTAETDQTPTPEASAFDEPEVSAGDVPEGEDSKLTGLAAGRTSEAGSERDSSQTQFSRAEAESAHTDDEPAQTDDEPAQTDDESARTDDGSARTDDEPTQTEDESAETQNESAETQNESAETQNESAETQNESAETQNESAETENESAETGDESLETGDESAPTENESAQAQDEANQDAHAVGEPEEGSDEAPTRSESAEADEVSSEPEEIAARESVNEESLPAEAEPSGSQLEAQDVEPESKSLESFAADTVDLGALAHELAAKAAREDELAGGPSDEGLTELATAAQPAPRVDSWPISDDPLSQSWGALVPGETGDLPPPSRSSIYELREIDATDAVAVSVADVASEPQPRAPTRNRLVAPSAPSAAIEAMERASESETVLDTESPLGFPPRAGLPPRAHEHEGVTQPELEPAPRRNLIETSESVELRPDGLSDVVLSRGPVESAEVLKDLAPMGPESESQTPAPQKEPRSTRVSVTPASDDTPPPRPSYQPPPLRTRAVVERASAPPPARKSAPPPARIAGIDFGSRFLRAAILEENQPQLVKVEDSIYFPAVVACRLDGGVVTGQEATVISSNDPSRAFSPRAVLAAIREGRIDQGLMVRPRGAPMPEVSLTQGRISVRLSDRTHDFEDLLTQLFLPVQTALSAALGSSRPRAVISIPDGLDEQARQLMAGALEKAGIEVVELLPELTAALEAYEVDRRPVETVLLVDLGASHLGLALARRGRTGFANLGARWVPEVSTQTFDDALLEVALTEVVRHDGVERAKDPLVRTRIADALSKTRPDHRDGRVDITLALPTGGASGVALQRTISLNGQRVEAALEPQVQRIMERITELLRESAVHPRALGTIVLAGNAAAYRSLVKALVAATGRAPLETIDPADVFAFGLARLGHKRERQVPVEPTAAPEHELKRSVGIALPGGRMLVLFPTSVPLPRRIFRVHSTTRDDQTEVDIALYQGDDEFISGCALLGLVTLDGLPKAKRGGLEVRVEIELDSDGVVTASLSEETSGRKVRFMAPSAQTPDARRAELAERPAVEDLSDRRVRQKSFFGRIFGR